MYFSGFSDKKRNQKNSKTQRNVLTKKNYKNIFLIFS